MLEAVLFDLDDTLLGNSMDVFLPAYFQTLTNYVDQLVPKQRFMRELMKATDAMNARRDGRSTNEEAFAAAFYPAVGLDRTRLEPVFEQFYAEEFPRLRSLTQKRPEARRLVDWARDTGLQVVVATNPLFPRVAVEQRLEWAGVPVQEFDYALVTTYENMHATKSDVAYYREILARLDREPDECLMVGDSLNMDIAPAMSIGIYGYWVTEAARAPRSGAELVGVGTLQQLWKRVSAQGSLLPASLGNGT